MSESSFPIGAYNDPSAPYNKKDNGKCSTCNGTGEICFECGYNSYVCTCDEPDYDECGDCNGTGDKSDEYESFKEDTR